MLATVQTLLMLAFPALVVVAALRDATTMTIPNWISLAMIAAFVPAAGAGLAAGMPLAQLGLCLAVGLGALVAGVAMFALRWIGGGDAKLFAAAALWLGVSGAAPFLLWTSLAGGALALSLLGARRALVFTGFPPPSPAWAQRLLLPEGDIPYGVAIAAGALAAFTESPLMHAIRG